MIAHVLLNLLFIEMHVIVLHCSKYILEHLIVFHMQLC